MYSSLFLMELQQKRLELPLVIELTNVCAWMTKLEIVNRASKQESIKFTALPKLKVSELQAKLSSQIHQIFSGNSYSTKVAGSGCL